MVGKRVTTNSSAPNGFTIVELLIVVVIIAILAAITIVAYNGITERTKRATLNTELSATQKKVQLYAVDNGESFPSSLGSIGVQGKEGGMTYRYSVNNTATPKTYCITAIDGALRSYTSSDNSSVRTGSCTGHDNDAAYTTNIVTNPSMEVDGTRWEVFGGATVQRVSEQAQNGSYSLRVTPSTTAAKSGVRITNLPVKASAEYAAVAHVRVLSALASNTNIMLEICSNGVCNGTWSTSVSAASWTRLNTITTSDGTNNGSVQISFNDSGNGGASVRRDYYIDSVALYDGTSPSAYRDGNSTNWLWNGAPGISSSSGPR